MTKASEPHTSSGMKTVLSIVISDITSTFFDLFPEIMQLNNFLIQMSTFTILFLYEIIDIVCIFISRKPLSRLDIRLA